VQVRIKIYGIEPLCWLLFAGRGPGDRHLFVFCRFFALMAIGRPRRKGARELAMNSCGAGGGGGSQLVSPVAVAFLFFMAFA
jgi:hypothetical protein